MERRKGKCNAILIYCQFRLFLLGVCWRTQPIEYVEHLDVLIHNNIDPIDWPEVQEAEIERRREGGRNVKDWSNEITNSINGNNE